MSLTIQYCSDLHLEFDQNKKWIAKYPLAVTGDILLLAGDIVPFGQIKQHSALFDFISANYQAAYWVPGNHEYYNADIKERSGTLHEAIRSNVFLVNNTTIDIGSTDIICSTLWSHIDTAHEWEITRAMSDFHVIKNNGARLTIADFNALHLQALQYIKQAVAASSAAHKIVMTHHIPTFMHYPEKYKTSVLNQAFAVELHDYIESSSIDYWIYGHHHSNTPDFTIGHTQMCTNQLGYVQYSEHSGFQRDKVITL